MRAQVAAGGPVVSGERGGTWGGKSERSYSDKGERDVGSESKKAGRILIERGRIRPASGDFPGGGQRAKTLRGKGATVRFEGKIKNEV